MQKMASTKYELNRLIIVSSYEQLTWYELLANYDATTHGLASSSSPKS